jgi:hypothetical protein
LHMFATIFKYFLVVFLSSVSEACFKCFICLLFYVASIASRCFKSKSSECSGSPSGWCRSNFQRCFSTPRWLLAADRPRPCNSGQRQLEAALQ